MDSNFDKNSINQKVQEEIDYFLKDEPILKSDVEYVFKIGIPDRPKAYLMLEFARMLEVAKERIMPFVIVADLIMAAAMNDDDIIDDNGERCGESSLWKIKGVNSTIMVTDCMYALVFSILKRYRPRRDEVDFDAYQKSENLLLDYFRVMNIAQYKTTISATSLETLTLNDLENLAIKKASLLFQFCSAVPAYFSNSFIKESEDFGYQLGIVRQYVSDAHDFLEVSPEHDHDRKGVNSGNARMEDYFTHQPNLVLLLTGSSNKLNDEDKKWFFNNWKAPVLEMSRVSVTARVMDLIKKADAIEEAKGVLREYKEKLDKSLSSFPNEEFRQNMSGWAFRSFPLS